MEPMYSAHYTCHNQPIITPAEAEAKWSGH
jgi:hypothetical protein